MATAVATELSGREKAAILLIALGPEKSSRIFKHLKEEEIEALTLEIANVSTVMPETKEKVLTEFYQICIAQQYIVEGGIAYAKQILEQALGQTKAFEVISKLTVSLQVRPFDFIRKTDASQILNFIQNEHRRRSRSFFHIYVLSKRPRCSPSSRRKSKRMSRGESRSWTERRQMLLRKWSERSKRNCLQ